MSRFTHDRIPPAPVQSPARGGSLVWMGVVILLMISGANGCTRIRLPAIDPTGSCLFSPLPTTTTFALPGTNGSCLNCLSPLRSCNCLSNLGSCLTRPALAFPTPAFPPAVDPPACPVEPEAVCCPDEPCVQSSGCSGECAVGPRATLLGTQTDCGGRGCGLAHCLGCRKMPDRGKRGCILLTPQKIVAPVGGEVVLLSGICGDDGYLQMAEPLEWMLSPDSVGNIIAVGDDEPGLIGRLAGARVRPEKRDPSYAIGVTSTKKTLITRGNLDPRDDVSLEKGQTWLTVSSPSEGTSRITVLAPESECWDQRKATATIYWVDARWTFPSSQSVPVNTTVELNTRVNRAEGGLPAAGWIVRYEIADPSLATFAGTNGSDVLDAKVDDDGNAIVQLVPTPGSAGTTAVNISIIRPGGLNDSLPKLTLGSGQTFVTWSAPALQIRAGGPPTATFRSPFEVVANLSNPGDQTATNVRVDLQLPPGVRVLQADTFATVTPNNIIWEIGSLPAQSQLDLFATLSAEESVSLPFIARGDGLAADDSVRVDVFRPSLQLTVESELPSVTAGVPAAFTIDITNTGNRPITDVTWVATGDSSMLHEGGAVDATNTRATPLNPGETWPVVVTFIPNTAGRRCINVVATAAGSQRADGQACLTAINPVPRSARINVRMEQKLPTYVGDQPQLVRFVVSNDGDAAANNVRTSIVFDRQLQLLSATEGADQMPGTGGGVSWSIPLLPTGGQETFEVQLRAVEPAASARVTARAESSNGIRGEDTIAIEIQSATSPSDVPRSTPLPPATAPPTIPGGPAPLQGSPLQGAPRNNAPPAAQRSGRLRTTLVASDNPVAMGAPIRYSLVIENDSNLRDSEIDVQFELPQGVAIERVVPITNPELSGYEVETESNRVLLELIRTLDPGDSIEYILQLVSNQPQTFDLTVSVGSLNHPQVETTTATTTVLR